MTYLKSILHAVETIFFDGMLLLVLYSYVIPALLYLAGFEDVPRTLSVELTLYVKAIDWTYKYLLPAVGHGKVRRNRALELILYFSFCASLFGYIIPSVGRVVKEKCRGQYSCWRHMSSLPSVTGALFQGSKTYSIDLSDGQWRNLRQSLPLLAAVALAVSAVGLPIVHVLAGTAVAKSSSASADSTSAAAQTARSRAHINAVYHGWIGLIFLLVAHRWHAAIILVILLLAWKLSPTARSASSLGRWIPARAVTVLVWMLVISVLLFKESYRLRYRPGLEWLQILFDQRRYGGLYAWQFPANFLVLRVASFLLDALWAVEHQERLARRKDADHNSLNALKDEDEDVTDEQIAADSPAIGPLDDPYADAHLPLPLYNWTNFFAYATYCPLYIAGPVLSFNAFVRGMHQRQTVENPIYYGLRWVACLALLEWLLTEFPFFAVINSGLFAYLSVGEMVVVAYGVLKLMWLKFTLIWRFFRLWALVDGQRPPENMAKCMSNNCSLESFWRGWHSSFNRWILRYLYLPMGGRQYRLANVWVVFLFVAAWHDLEPKLLVWALLNGAFYALEAISRAALKAVAHRLPEARSNGLQVAGGALYIMVLVGVNLTGYAVGISGLHGFLAKIATLDGFRTGVVTFLYLSVAVCFMNFVARRDNSITSPRAQ